MVNNKKPEQILEQMLDLANELHCEVTVDFELIGIQELRESINIVELKIHDLRRRFEEHK